MRVPFDEVFEAAGVDMVPRMPIAIGVVTVARGVPLAPVGRLGGLPLADFPEHDLDVDASSGIAVIRGLLRRRPLIPVRRAEKAASAA